jgi:enoyl-CoA hydratase/carnithine racemase
VTGTARLPHEREADTTGTVYVEHNKGVAVVTLARPHKRNALTMQMWRSLEQQVMELSGSADLDAIVVTGQRDVFSAGADLTEVRAASASRSAAEEYCHSIVGALAAVAWSPVPTVALLNGVASGGGAEIALAADSRIALPRAAMQFPMSRLGVVPDALTRDRMVQSVGALRANWLLLTGRLLDARSCRDMGLIDELVDERLVDEALERLVLELRISYNAGHRRSKELMLGATRRPIAELAEEMVESFIGGEVGSRAARLMNRKRTVEAEE